MGKVGWTSPLLPGGLYFHLERRVYRIECLLQRCLQETGTMSARNVSGEGVGLGLGLGAPVGAGTPGFLLGWGCCCGSPMVSTTFSCQFIKRLKVGPQLA